MVGTGLTFWNASTSLTSCSKMAFSDAIVKSCYGVVMKSEVVVTIDSQRERCAPRYTRRSECLYAMRMSVRRGWLKAIAGLEM